MMDLKKETKQIEFADGAKRAVPRNVTRCHVVQQALERVARLAQGGRLDRLSFREDVLRNVWGQASIR